MSFPGMGFASIPSSVPVVPGAAITPTQLLQANILTVTKVSNPGGGGVSIAPAAVPAEGMGWMAGQAANVAGAGLLKYIVKNEQGVDVVLVDSNIADHTGTVSLSLRSSDNGEFLRLVSQPAAAQQVINLLLPTGESLGDIFVETRTKKDKDKNKDKEGKDGKQKKEEEGKKSKEEKEGKKLKEEKEGKKPKEEKEKKEKDKHKDSPKRKYLLKNTAGQEVMSVSIKSKPKDLKIEMKIKSLQRKGEVCIVESVGGPGTLQIKFSANSASIPNEKLYGLGAALGIIDLELDRLPASGPSGVVTHGFPVASH